MPVTARLSKAFYDRFGDDIVDELVEWLNQVDATYRSDLRELNELNFARFDAKLEQRLASLDAKIDLRIAEVDRRMAATEARLDKRISDVEATLDKRISEVEATLDKRITEVEATLGARISESQSTMSLAMQREFKEQNRMHYLAWAIQIAAIVGLYAR